jgi:hypothetical protein
MTSPNRVAVVFDRFAGRSADDCAKFTDSVARALESNSEVLRLCCDGDATARPRWPIRGLRQRVRTAIREFRPHSVIYIPGAKSPLSVFSRGFALRRSTPRANHVTVVLVPFPKPTSPGSLLRLLYPELILVPSYRSLLTLSRLSLKGDVCPLGVDPAAFTPADPAEKAALRKQYGIDKNAFVFLIGSTPADPADLDTVISLARQDEVQIVANSRSDVGGGIRVIRQVQDARQLFGLADCYVFTETDDGGSVEFPMGVIEALSCGLPVITTPFGGLRDFCPEGEDLHYWSTPEELGRAAQYVREITRIRVRGVEEFSWNNIVQRITNRFVD